MVFPIAGVVVRRAREITANNNYKAIGYAGLLSGVPEVIDAVGEFCEKRRLLGRTARFSSDDLPILDEIIFGRSPSAN